MTLRASEMPTARYLDVPGEYILYVADYFRRDTAKGVPALHARMEVICSWDGEKWSKDRQGMKVTRPFPLRGPGLGFLGDLLRATGNPEIELEPDDDAAIARAICLQPFRGLCRLSKPVPSRKRPGETVRFMNVVQIRPLEREDRSEIDTLEWPASWSAITDWAALCVQDPRR